MNDDSILHRISALVTEEHALREGGDAQAAERLRHVGEQLDQCWDLLRQRRARREFGEDPAGASVRDVKTVRNYEG